MKRFIKRHQSPALVVSVIALVAAAGGTALAGPVASTAKKAKGDNKQDQKLLKSASVAHATTADTATNSTNLGGFPASAYAGRLFARVSGTGTTPTLAAGSPGVTVEAARPFTGAARVDFPVDMSNCAVVVTGVTGGTEVAARQSTISSGKVVAIVTYDIGGATESNESFNVIGEC